MEWKDFILGALSGIAGCFGSVCSFGIAIGLVAWRQSKKAENGALDLFKGAIDADPDN